MTRSNEITKELLEISPELARLTATNPYRVPAGYFDTLAENILQRMKLREGGSVPDEVSAKDEIAALSPLLGGLKKATPYSLPEGYFEQLVPKIPAATEQQKGGKVISMSAKRLFKYAAAAVVAGLITIAGWMYLTGPAVKTDQIAFNSDSAVENVALEEQMMNISDGEIEDFLQGSSVQSMVIVTAPSSEIQDEDIRLMLANISDKELEKYLEQLDTRKENFN